MAAVLYVLILVARIHHLTVNFPAPGSGITWVVVGSDEVSHAPSAVAAAMGTLDEAPGQRADAVLIIHEFGYRTTVLSVPRDLLVSPAPGSPQRLALTLQKGPQALVDGLCNTLGVATSRLVVVGFSGFSSIVDTLGGVSIELPYPVRDPSSALNLMRSGTVHIDGHQALSLVRSRQAQYLVGGKWVTVPGGSAQRADWAAKVLNSLVDAAKDHVRDPWAMQALAWTATGSLTVSQNVGVFDLAKMAHMHGEAVVLPTGAIPGQAGLQSDDSTRSALRAAGYGGRCTVSRPR